MILTAGTALGAEAGNALRRRYQTLETLRMLMGMLKGELSYGAVPLEELFQRLADRTNRPLGRFFREVAGKMQESGNGLLEDILNRQRESCLCGCGLTEKEQQQLVQICTLLGRMDRDAQIQALNGYLMAIELEEKAALEKMRQKETMYRYLGFMGGLFLAVLFY